MVGGMDTILFPHRVWRDVMVPGLAAVAGGAAVPGVARAAGVSQRHRLFQPGALALDRGDLVGMVDAAPLVHRACVASLEFSLAPGGQRPGARTGVRLTVPHTFAVRRGIHPRMHLYATVR